tara:strand:- start:1206 stop:2063 length:858 start_codon:yes stop_codon:yes gene_type:complete
MINTEADARERIRIMLDRADAPYLSDNEIDSYIEMATDEYIRERVGKFDSTQKLRDDLGEYVKSKVFVSEEAQGILLGDSNEPIDLYNSGDNLGHVASYKSYSNIDSGNSGSYLGEYSLNINDVDSSVSYVLGIDVRYIDNLSTTDAANGRVNFVGSHTIDTSYVPCKIISLDELTSIMKDPFNKPEIFSHVAIRIGDIYHINAGVTGFEIENAEKRDASDNLTEQYCFILNWVSGLISINFMVAWLPIHGKEEVCKIAVRKILGVTADDRYVSQQVEIQQTDKK